jgi:N-acylneuraminate cytidylyltransferase
MSESKRPNVLAIIPARGGSKGIKRKNLAEVGGVPLVGRAIQSARSAKLVTHVAVSTDDSEIGAVAAGFGSDVIARPPDISNDTASSESAILHALDFVTSRGQSPDIVVMIQCTSPFLSSVEIDGTIAEIAEGRVDSCFAASPFHHFLWSRGEDGVIAGVNHGGGLRVRRQDLHERQFLESGSVYAMRVDTFRKTANRFCGRVGIYASDPLRTFEIDDPQELAFARAIEPLIDRDRNSVNLPSTISCVVFDFDGVLTDNGVYIGQNDEESVRCDRSDGLGLDRLRQIGIPILVISKERNPVVTTRCEKLRLPVLQGVDNKLNVLKIWLRNQGHDPDGVIYVGNDINDAECLNFAACAVGPSDAHPAIRHQLDIRLSMPGGHGAVRELCDLIDRALAEGRSQLSKPAALEDLVNGYLPGQRDRRPWGNWEVVATGARWCVKLIEVMPGGILSLQRHQFRDEAWVVTEGHALVTLEGKETRLTVGETITIRRGEIHRLSNPGEGRLLLLELQTGTRLLESDIVRLQDNYGRS